MLKTSTCKYFLLFGVVGILLACSTKKNSFVNRNYHAVTTEYNVLYNGNLALTAGLTELTATYQDNFWEVLPIERMQPVTAQPVVAADASAPAVKDLPPTPGAGTGKDKGGKTPNNAPASLAVGGGKDTEQKNANFARAEEKATKAIQKHSMNLGGSEKNPQIDEAHLLLGQARYYENRFVPALEAFNYILLKYPTSDKIADAKIWREKTNIRLDNENIAIKNLKQLIIDKQATMEPQTFADANAILAEAYLKAESQDSAVYVLKKAAEFTEDKEQKARYNFILGQLYSKLNYPDSAHASFQKVIDMKRKSPRRYVIQAHAMQAGQFDYAKGDTLAFMEKYKELLEDRENRPYLDVLNHQVALFYDKQDLDDKAKTYYNRSLRANSKDPYLTASNHRNLAEIYFEDAKYPMAGIYYDSTMVYMNNRTREYRAIKKKRDNLADVIKYEAIAQTNDSILHIISLNEAGRKAFFDEYITRLKEQDERERKRLEAEAIRQENMAAAMSDNGGGNTSMTRVGGGVAGAPGDPSALGLRGTSPATRGEKSTSLTNPAVVTPSGRSSTTGQGGATGTSGSGAGGKFYFYTPSTVAFGKMEFQKKWGKRTLADNWRWSSEQRNATGTDATENDSLVADAGADKALDPRYTPEFYLSQLPTDQKVLDSLAKDRNFAYYQLGSIYKEKFKEYRLAADKLERLLQNNPEERLVLPSKYNLYKIYQIIDPAKAEQYKQQILNEYPDSRYAEIVRNPDSNNAANMAPEAAYAALFKQYEEGKLREVYAQIDEAIDTYTGEDIVSKFELLKAKLGARLLGLEEYKKQLNFVALNYPNSSEGKEADDILKNDLPLLEKVEFGRPTVTWKIVFKFDSPNDPRIKPLTEKIQKFIKEGLNNSITLSDDVYTLTENMLVVHGFINKLAAEDAVSVLKDYKTYKVAETPVIMSSEDYKVIQIKKNFNQFSPVE